jgi:hypothetical protein
MAQRCRVRALVVATVVALAAAACGGGSKKSNGTTTTVAGEGASGTGSATVNPLFVATDAEGKSTGGTNPVTVLIRPSTDGKLRVGFSEDEVAGTGDQWRAAGWSAVTVATLLTGAPLRNREVQFDVSGRIDGPSAGALMTVAVLSILRNEPMQNDVTMTGAINPDGTIGPVGGIPYKVDGAVEAQKKRMLIPAGQRNATDDDGDPVDVVDVGRRKGVEVSEVEDIFAAYRAFTGKELPRPAPSTNTRLDETTYQKLQAKVTTWLARFDRSVGEFGTLPAAIRQELSGLATDADTAHEQAQKLTQNGLQAGAFSRAIQAAALANAAVRIGQNFQLFLDGDVDGFVSRIRASQAIRGEVRGFVDSLKAYQPKTVSDAGALAGAYADAIDAVSMSEFGESLFNAEAATRAEALQNALIGAVYYELAGTLLEAARDAFDVSRDLGGPPLGTGIDLHDVSEFFRRGGQANLEAFETLIIEPAAERANLSATAAKAAFANADTGYALSVSAVNVMSALEEYFGDAATSDFATLGGSALLYIRAAGLLATYYSLGEIDPETNELTGIKNDRAFQAAIDLAQSQLSGGIGLLQSKQVNPTIAVANNEIAGVEREGDAPDKLEALGTYWTGYINTRVLAYLGGFAAT